MARLLCDTHSFYWYLVRSPKLSRASEQAIRDSIAAGEPVCVPSVSLVELTYLVDKRKIPSDLWTQVLKDLDAPDWPFDILPLDSVIARAVSTVPRESVPDLPDRVIAATALVHDLTLVTCDEKLRGYAALRTLW